MTQMNSMLPVLAVGLWLNLADLSDHPYHVPGTGGKDGVLELGVMAQVCLCLSTFYLPGCFKWLQHTLVLLDLSLSGTVGLPNLNPTTFVGQLYVPGFFEFQIFSFRG